MTDSPRATTRCGGFKPSSSKPVSSSRTKVDPACGCARRPRPRSSEPRRGCRPQPGLSPRRRDLAVADDDLPGDETAAKAEPEERVRLKEDDPEAFLAQGRELLKLAVYHWHWRRSALLRESLNADEGTPSRAAQEHGLEMVSNAVHAIEGRAHLVDDREAEVLWYAADLIRDGLKGTFPKFPDMDVKGRLTKHGRLTTAQRNAIAVADAIAKVSYRPAKEKLL